MHASTLAVVLFPGQLRVWQVSLHGNEATLAVWCTYALHTYEYTLLCVRACVHGRPGKWVYSCRGLPLYGQWALLAQESQVTTKQRNYMETCKFSINISPWKCKSMHVPMYSLHAFTLTPVHSGEPFDTGLWSEKLLLPPSVVAHKLLTWAVVVATRM